MTPIYDFSSIPTIETERLRLRALRMDDADADGLISVFGDPRVLEYLGLDPPCTTREQAYEMLHWMDSWRQEGSGARWAITLRSASDRLIGTCGFHRYEAQNRRAEIGYDLAAAYWGSGYVTEAAAALVRWCFDALDLNRVEADITDGNIGSERVLLKNGFKVEGIWRERVFEHGRFVDIKQFGLLRREYYSE